jgi:hypothetical protein
MEATTRAEIDEWAHTARVGESLKAGVYRATVKTRDYYGWMRVSIYSESEEQSTPDHLFDITYCVREGTVLM